MARSNGDLVLLARDRRRLERMRDAQAKLDQRKREAVRELHGLPPERRASLRELGDALGVSHATIRNWLRESD